MSQFILRNIDIELTPRSLQKAINEINKLSNDLDKALQSLAERLVEQGIEVAKMEIVSMGAVYSGELYESISGEYDPKTHIGTIRAGAEYAVYVEFGTGIIGEENPHPQAGELGINYPAANKYGIDGWVYKNDKDGKLHWTMGMPSRPFMYNTFRDLEAEAERRGGKLIATYLP